MPPRMNEDRPSPRIAPRRRRWPLWLALALAGLIAAAWAVVAVLFPPARVRALVQSQLSRTLARDVRFDRAGVALWPPVRLWVRGLAVAETGGFARGAVFETRALELDLDLL